MAEDPVVSSRPLRVAVLAERLGTAAGGTETYERCLIEALFEEAAHSGDEVVPILAWPAAVTALSPSIRPACRLLRPLGKTGTILSTSRMVRQVAADVVHCCFVIPPLPRPVPVVATIHDLGFVRHAEHYPPLLAWRLKLALRRSTRRANVLVCDSETTRKDLEELEDVSRVRTTTIYPGIHDRFKRAHATAEGAATVAGFGVRAPYILYCGRTEPRKNVPNLIEAYDRLRSSGRFHGQLVMLGANRTFLNDEAQSRIDRSPHRNDIIQTGHVPDSVVPAFYFQAGVLAFVSLFEGFGFPMLEAMAAEVPVVCSTATCLPEIAGGASLLVAPDDPDAIADALQRALHDPEERRRLIEKGKARVAAFTWQGAARSFLEVYREAATPSP
jgi:glycosyltransferase involved in cell wall biosynthesis